ncbi:hypothetical protein KKB83_02580, partial [Patescibacteria group bacterium]|nr:hypothetical protein [Patescibacteria group bacterium]
RSYQINGLTAEKWCFGLCSSNGGGWISCEGSEQYFTCADVVAGALPTPTPVPEPVPDEEKFDINGDGVVDVDDLVDLLKCWGKTYCPLPRADIDRNGEINARDALALVMYLLLSE